MVIRNSEMKMKRIILGGLLVACGLSACQHKDLCMDHNHNANLMLEVNWYLEWNLEYFIDWETQWHPDWKVDWSKIIPDEPEGVRLVAQSSDDARYRQVYNLPSGGGAVELQPGRYSTLLYNNDTEYIIFEDADLSSAITATTRSRTRSPYSENNPQEVTVNSPDYLFSSYDDDFLIDEKLYDAVTGDVIRIVVDVPMYPVVLSYIVRYEFTAGKEYVVEARGALSGMAGTVNLSTRRTLDDVVTVLYDEAEVSDYGVEAVVRSFGLCNFDPVPTDEYPHGHFYSPDEIDSRVGVSRQDRPRAGEETRNILTLELALRSGKVKTIETDVTDQVLQQPRGGVLIVKDIEVTPDEGEGNNDSGFDVDVNDWADNEQIDLPI